MGSAGWFSLGAFFGVLFGFMATMLTVYMADRSSPSVIDSCADIAAKAVTKALIEFKAKR